jgi:hypothetical protein
MPLYLRSHLCAYARGLDLDHVSRCPRRIIAAVFIDIISINEFFNLQYIIYLEPRMIINRAVDASEPEFIMFRPTTCTWHR